MATERGPKFEGDDYGSRHEARVDHHEEFGRIESNDYMARARLKETFEGTPTFAAERSVDATGQAFDHQQYAQNDSAFATGAAGYDYSDAQRVFEEQQAAADSQYAAQQAYADQQYAAQQAYEAQQFAQQQQYEAQQAANDFYRNSQQYSPQNPDYMQPIATDPAYASGSARFVEEGGLQTDISVYEDGRYMGSQSAQEGGVFGSAPESGMFAAPLHEVGDNRYGDYGKMGDYDYRRNRPDDVMDVSDSDAGSDPNSLADAASAGSRGLGGGATYLDTWANEELAARKASVSEVLQTGDEGQVVETAGDVFFVDKKFNYAEELASEGDGTFDIDKALGDKKSAKSEAALLVEEGEPDSILAKVGKKGKNAAKGAVKGAAFTLLDDATGMSSSDVDEVALKTTPGNIKKAKGFYSKIHGVAAQDNLAAGQLAARRGIGKNFFRQAIRGNMVEVPRGNPLSVIKNAFKKVFGTTGGNIVKTGGAKVLLLAATSLMVVMIPMFAFSSCVLSSGGSGGGGGGAEAFTSWAESIAKDDKVGYSQPNRTTFASRDQNGGYGDVDCSSFVYYALLNNGWTEDELGGSWPFATYGMCDILENCGFQRIDYVRTEGARQLQRGDIVVDIDQHVEIYIGEGKAVAAHCDERGGIEGAKMGDQTGNEVSISVFSASYWQPDVIMRCTRTDGNAGNFDGNSNAEKAWNYFTSRGYSEAATAGIIGNLMQESSLDPNCAQYGGGPGRGIAQWEIGSDRYARLCSMASSWGYSWNDIEAQLMFIDWELNGNEATCAYLMNSQYGGLAAFKSTNDVSNATLVFLKCYERAGIAAFSNRLQYALDAYAAFA